MTHKIRFATLGDVESIMQFINEHWKENHILSSNRKFFLYEFKEGQKINFVLALGSDNKVLGILGFIKASQCSGDIFTVMWKALKVKYSPMLGIEMFNFLRYFNKQNRIIGVGANANTLPLYDYLGLYTDSLNQYYIVNKDIRKYHVIKVNNEESYFTPINDTNGNREISVISEERLRYNFDSNNFIPHKDESYFIKKYFHHPINKYDVHGVSYNGKISSLFVTRVQEYQASKILRIVEYIGDQKDIIYATTYLYNIILANSYEYVDFLCFGFDHDNLLKAGFNKLDPHSDDVIVPNYFSPFIQKNIIIYFMADTVEIEKIRLCKADGDQDRPS